MLLYKMNSEELFFKSYTERKKQTLFFFFQEIVPPEKKGRSSLVDMLNLNTRAELELSL